jgi:hypothetical protein
MSRRRISNPIFPFGGRVRLTPRYAAALNRRPHCRVDWTARQGTVAWCNENNVSVIWDGCVRGEWIPVKGVELAAVSP